MNPVAVVGVGVMGSAIAGRLMDTGCPVIAYDLSAQKCSALAVRGAQIPVTGLSTELHRLLVAGGLGAADSAEYVRLFDLGADADP